MTPPERQAVLEVLHSERFIDQAPAEVYHTFLEEGVYHCSIRSMYTILKDQGEVRERRDQLRHPDYKKPELLATRPNQVWSWDITKLLGLQKWTYFYLYVIMDIFSRYVVGWLVASRESAQLMADLGIVKSLSRFYVSNDNPFSESHFKTLKYRPEFPRAEARAEERAEAEKKQIEEKREIARRLVQEGMAREK